MWEAHLICSAGDCYAEIEVGIDSLDELDGLSCDCGHGFILLAISEVALA